MNLNVFNNNKSFCHYERGKDKPFDRLFILFTIAFQCIGVMASVLNRPYPQVVWLDSVGYLFAHEVRSPLYSLFLQLYKYVVGYDSFILLIVIQMLILLISVYHCTQVVYTHMRCSKQAAYAIFLLLLSPCWITSFVIEQPFIVGGVAVSEAFSYPLFLIAFSYLLSGIYTKNTKHLCYFMFWVMLLALTRRQFIVLYPFCFGLSVFLYLFQRRYFKSGVILCCALASLFANEMLERSYRYVWHGYFSPPPFFGPQLLVPALFLADKEDIELFQSPTDKILFTQMYSRIEHYSISEKTFHLPFGQAPLVETHPLEDQPLFRVKGWKEEDRITWQKSFVDFFPKEKQEGVFQYADGTIDAYKLYHYIYNYIFHQVITPIFWGNKITSWAEFNAVSTRMSFTLLNKHLHEYIQLYSSVLIASLEGWLGTTLCLLILTLSGYYAMTKRQPFATMVFFMIIIHMGNIAGISILETALFRYTFYTYFLFVAFAIVSFDHWCHRRKGSVSLCAE